MHLATLGVESAARGSESRRARARTFTVESGSFKPYMARSQRAEAAGDDDLGTLVVAQEVLAYARWKIDGIRARKQTQEIERQAQAAAQRSTERRSSAQTPRSRETKLREDHRCGTKPGAARSDAPERCPDTNLIVLPDPFPVSEARARLEQAQEWEAAASAWLAAAEERERWAAGEAERAATPNVLEQLQAERDAAVAEQADAEAERRSAQAQQREARADLEVVIEARAKFEELIRPVREENLRRVQAAEELQRQGECPTSRGQPPAR